MYPICVVMSINEYNNSCFRIQYLTTTHRWIGCTCEIIALSESILIKLIYHTNDCKCKQFYINRTSKLISEFTIKTVTSYYNIITQSKWKELELILV